MPTTTAQIPTTTAQIPTTTAQMPYSQVCKVDLSKFPQYYFLLKNNASEHMLVKYSCVFTVILLLLVIVALLIGFLHTGWVACIFYSGFAIMAITAWAGFIILIKAVNNYQKVSKILKIFNNPNTIGNCNVIISSNDNINIMNPNISNGDNYKIFMGSKDAIGYIQFSTVLLILLYTIITCGFVVLAILSLFKD